jgi:ATPase subunit of ABC transporter with duplicated ATPase domains
MWAQPGRRRAAALQGGGLCSEAAATSNEQEEVRGPEQAAAGQDDPGEEARSDRELPEDGKRYKTQSLQKLSDDYIRLAQKVVIEQDDPVIRMRFPNPVWPPGMLARDALIKAEDFAFGFDPVKVLFEHVTLNVTRKSKVCIVGRIGAGTSTLVNLFAGSLDAKERCSRGTLWLRTRAYVWDT